jgi:hypothetical protein
VFVWSAEAGRVCPGQPGCLERMCGVWRGWQGVVTPSFRDDVVTRASSSTGTRPENMPENMPGNMPPEPEMVPGTGTAAGVPRSPRAAIIGRAAGSRYRPVRRPSARADSSAERSAPPRSARPTRPVSPAGQGPPGGSQGAPGTTNTAPWPEQRRPDPQRRNRQAHGRRKRPSVPPTRPSPGDGAGTRLSACGACVPAVPGPVSVAAGHTQHIGRARRRAAPGRCSPGPGRCRRARASAIRFAAGAPSSSRLLRLAESESQSWEGADAVSGVDRSSRY